MTTNRRDFLRLSAAVGLSLGTDPTRLFSDAIKGRGPEKRALVLLELNGGQDGLNTVVPVESAAYYDRRKKIAIRKESVTKFADDVYVAPELSALQPAYKNGRMAIIENVGYPKPDRSHFRSMDIWQSAETEDTTRRTGWLGRFAQHERETKKDGDRPLFFIGSGPTPVALTGGPGSPVVLPHAAALESFSPSESSPTRRKTAEKRKADLEFLEAQNRAMQKIAGATKAIAARKPAVAYPPTELGERFSLIAGLIASGFGDGIFQVKLDGFDTHAGQKDTLPVLQTTYAKAVAAFLADLEASGLLGNVLVVAFSEFGRRVAENGSAGTDHGAAGPMFLFGERIVPGRLNGPCRMEPLVDGDLAPNVDFRTVYVAVLEQWFGEKSARSIVHAPSDSTIRLVK